MLQNYFRKALVMVAVLSTVAVACTPDNELDNSSPAHQIKESENLVIPDQIELDANLPAGNTRVATFFAEGVQKYKARLIAGSVPAAYEWALVAPKANLYDVKNKNVGTHTAGPTWQLYGGQDSIYGQHFTPARTAPSPDGSIDWLQLKPKDGKILTGLFAGVSYIQRIATKGGKAPATPPVSATDTIDVRYSAIYRFTKKN